MTRRKGHDPVHTFRASADLVAEARRVGAGDGDTTLSDVVRQALAEYIARRAGSVVRTTYEP